MVQQAVRVEGKGMLKEIVAQLPRDLHETFREDSLEAVAREFAQELDAPDAAAAVLRCLQHLKKVRHLQAIAFIAVESRHLEFSVFTPYNVHDPSTLQTFESVDALCDTLENQLRKHNPDCSTSVRFVNTVDRGIGDHMVALNKEWSADPTVSLQGFLPC